MSTQFSMDSERRGHVNRPTSLLGSVVGVKGGSKPSGFISNGNAVNSYKNGTTGKQALPLPLDVSNSNNSHINSGKSDQRSSQKRGKGWLGLCYPSLGSGKGRTGAVSSGSESPSPTDSSDRDKNGKIDKDDGENSETDDESPTDGGFKIPNSQSNERPTSLPVALQLNSSSRLNQPIIHGEVYAVFNYAFDTFEVRFCSFSFFHCEWIYWFSVDVLSFYLQSINLHFANHEKDANCEIKVDLHISK